MDDQKQQLLKKLNESTNVLLTVAASPSVDQLAAIIGLTLMLNKLGKHATAVFSGEIPSTIEFLQPEKTLEKNTDSLRDFIVALDKEKADKLRYKVEDKLVKIFITPYRTSLSEKDLDFSQGDFNIDLILALGVASRSDLDKAITAHGRILHDATVATLNTKPVSGLGSIQWIDPKASSLCEMAVMLAEQLGNVQLDNQMATALLTGIVAETKRFSNDKTSATTMAVSAKLMAAGANQQLVATKLQEKPKPPPQPVAPPPPQITPLRPPIQPASTTQPVQPLAPVPPPPPQDGSLIIDHINDSPAIDSTSDAGEKEEEELEQIHIDEHGTLSSPDAEAGNPAAQSTSPPEQASTPPADTEEQEVEGTSEEEEPETPFKSAVDPTKMVFEPPRMGGQLTASTGPALSDSSVDPLSQPTLQNKILSHDVAMASSVASPVQEPEQTSTNDVPEESQTESPKTEETQPEVPEPAAEPTIEAPPAEPPTETSAPEELTPLVDSQTTSDVDLQSLNQPQGPIAEQAEKPNESSAEPEAEQTIVSADSSVGSDPGVPPGIIPDKKRPELTEDPSAPPLVPPPMMPPVMPPTPGGDDKKPGDDQPVVL